MKKAKFITGVMACMVAALAVTGCNLELSDEGTRASTATATTTVETTEAATSYTNVTYATEETKVGEAVVGTMHYYKLNYDDSAFASYVKTVGGVSCIDPNAATATADSKYTAGPIDWSNPLIGKTITGFTFVCDAYYTSGAAYDAMLNFYSPSTSTSAASFLSVMEDGSIRGNNTANVTDMYFEDTGNNGDVYQGTVGAWTKLAITVASNGTITYYVNGVAFDPSKDSGGAGAGATWANINTALTETWTNIGIGVGSTWWAAGYVDAGDYIANLRIYPTALTAAQVAALN